PPQHVLPSPTRRSSDLASAEMARQLVAEGLSPEPGGQFDVEAAYKQGKLASLTGGRWPNIGIRNLDMVDETVIVNWPTKVANGSDRKSTRLNSSHVKIS